jgi:hypothetical protein
LDRARLTTRGLTSSRRRGISAHAPHPVPLAHLARVAGARWKIEDGFAAGKELAALDEHQVRSWTSWHRWTILALLACVFLSVQAAAQPHGTHPGDGQLIPLTRHEIRRLFTLYPFSQVTLAHVARILGAYGIEVEVIGIPTV